MTPPPLVAVALLGLWVLVLFWATTSAATGQACVDNRLDSVVPDERLERPDNDTETGFVTADD